jgi:hypothetical protein
MPLTDCIACKRWKLFDEKPCAAHPDFKTAKDIAAEEEAEKWRKAEESMELRRKGFVGGTEGA